MATITPQTTANFSDGQRLTASDMNRIASDLDTVFSAANTLATDKAAASVATIATNAQATANTAMRGAESAHEIATAASSTALEALNSASTANNLANENRDILERLNNTAYKFVRIYVGSGYDILQQSVPTFDFVVYDTSIHRYAFGVTRSGAEPLIYGNAANASDVFQQMSGGGWHSPLPNILFSDGRYLYHGYGTDLHRLSTTIM